MKTIGRTRTRLRCFALAYLGADGKPPLPRGASFLSRTFAGALRGSWNSVWKRFDRLSKACVFEAFFDKLGSMSSTAHLVQLFGSIVVRAHVSAAEARGGQEGQALRRSHGGFTIVPVIHHKAKEKNKPAFFARVPLQGPRPRRAGVGDSALQAGRAMLRKVVSFVAGRCLIQFVHRA
jgi:hypothetical protein